MEEFKRRERQRTIIGSKMKESKSKKEKERARKGREDVREQ